MSYINHRWGSSQHNTCVQACSYKRDGSRFKFLMDHKLTFQSNTVFTNRPDSISACVDLETRLGCDPETASPGATPLTTGKNFQPSPNQVVTVLFFSWSSSRDAVSVRLLCKCLSFFKFFFISPTRNERSLSCTRALTTQIGLFDRFIKVQERLQDVLGLK